MQKLVGIFRNKEDLERSLGEIAKGEETARTPERRRFAAV